MFEPQERDEALTAEREIEPRDERAVAVHAEAERRTTRRGRAD